jgi:hypothetical protein
VKKQKFNENQIRQGDVLIEMREVSLEAFCQMNLEGDGSATIAHGEVTGHRHRFVAHSDGGSDAILYAHPVAPTEPVCLRLNRPSALMHEEHGAPTIPSGVGRISRPYEYQGAELIRRVED